MRVSPRLWYEVYQTASQGLHRSGTSGLAGGYCRSAFAFETTGIGGPEGREDCTHRSARASLWSAVAERVGRAAPPLWLCPEHHAGQGSTSRRKELDL